MAKILIHVQHLLGSGHAHRMAAIAAAAAARGHDVTLASGGRPLKLALGEAKLAQLPSLVAADARFKDLRDDQDRPIDAAWRSRRAAATRDLFLRLKPDLLVVELYPFGRSMLTFELEALLDDARGIPVLCSVRDVLQRPAEAAKAAARVAAVSRFDAVLVHGDRDFLPLQASWPETASLGAKLHYTGYVGPAEGAASTARDEVVVSVGGGAAGKELLAATLALAERRANAGEKWRIRVGNATNVPTCANPHIVCEPNQADFADLLRHARLSISQAGYNTCVDLLRARCPAILVPFDAGNEREQTIRAHAFAEAGLAQLCTPATLAAAIDNAQKPRAHNIACEGAAQTAKLFEQWLHPIPLPTGPI
ncbi:MAG: glycosyl transferase family 28 [Telmatospirillum sp.]|nr:glycosyl transferase family 28 [Telmatospirillum sp.]